MATFVLTCTDHPSALDRRMAAREAHLAYVQTRRDMVRLAGPLLNDAGEMAGSLFIMEAEDRAAVEAFVASDPYSLAGVFQKTEIRPFKITVGAIA
jgi:uncharacterized protein